MVPVAAAVAIEVLVGLERENMKSSSGSALRSAATLTVMTWLVSPAAKVTVPEGSVPSKSEKVLGYCRTR